MTTSQDTNCSLGALTIHTLTHSYTNGAASGATWGSVSCSRTLQQGLESNQICSNHWKTTALFMLEQAHDDEETSLVGSPDEAKLVGTHSNLNIDYLKAFRQMYTYSPLPQCVRP